MVFESSIIKLITNVKNIRWEGESFVLARRRGIFVVTLQQKTKNYLRYENFIDSIACRYRNHNNQGY